MAKYEVFILLWNLSHIRWISWGKKPETSHMSHDDISGWVDVARKFTERLLGAIASARRSGKKRIILSHLTWKYLETFERMEDTLFFFFYSDCSGGLSTVGGRRTYA